jgi:hypothetical protein
MLVIININLKPAEKGGAVIERPEAGEVLLSPLRYAENIYSFLFLKTMMSCAFISG